MGSVDKILNVATLNVEPVVQYQYYWNRLPVPFSSTGHPTSHDSLLGGLMMFPVNSQYSVSGLTIASSRIDVHYFYFYL